MGTSKNIQASIDELACFITRLIATAYEHDGKRLNYFNLKEIHKRVINDLSVVDFKQTRKEFKELLYVYQLVSSKAEEEDHRKHLDIVNKIHGTS
jgi:hypothetical protein